MQFIGNGGRGNGGSDEFGAHKTTPVVVANSGSCTFLEAVPGVQLERGLIAKADSALHGEVLAMHESFFNSICVEEGQVRAATQSGLQISNLGNNLGSMVLVNRDDGLHINRKKNKWKRLAREGMVVDPGPLFIARLGKCNGINEDTRFRSASSLDDFKGS
ncbi:hypothetical protein ACOSQ4_012463 [Xanthoceras sorbifolium]